MTSNDDIENRREIMPSFYSIRNKFKIFTVEKTTFQVTSRLQKFRHFCGLLLIKPDISEKLFRYTKTTFEVVPTTCFSRFFTFVSLNPCYKKPTRYENNN
jgi:hypothetical protein